MAGYPKCEEWVCRALREGQVIPAHPLALTANRKLDERRQRALTRYYHAAGAGGIAVAVHTTQFAIREPEHGLLRPVLELASKTVQDCDARTGRQSVRIAGVCGQTRQAVSEAELARDYGFHLALLSLGAMKDASLAQLIDHCRAVASELPLFGFYLQPAAGGRPLPIDFWRKFFEIPNVCAVKIAPFNRYQTLDVIRALAESGRSEEIALYTGNDDNIVVDLLTTYAIPIGRENVRAQIAGGLLGQWACGIRAAVELLARCKEWRQANTIPASALTLAAELTDFNSAVFDVANGFRGCIPGIHEVLRAQGLLVGTWCLDQDEVLSPGQAEQIQRVKRSYPHLQDDEFVRSGLQSWLAD